MDPDKIKELIELISNSNFEKFELEEGDFKLKLVKQGAGKAKIPTVAAELTHDAQSAPIPDHPEHPSASSRRVDSDLIDIPSPIVGTFYSASNPESPPFVTSGTKVTKGQILCIVEAMKVMNEIESEHDGEIVEVLVANGQPVEFGEPVFRLRPA